MTKKTILILFIFCSLNSKYAKAQWSITTWPQGSYDFEQTFLQFLNADTAYGLVGDKQKTGSKYTAKPVFVRTIDQGQTWDSISSSDSAGGNFFFYDYAHGVTSGYNSIYRTKDSGKTWQKVANADTIYLFSSFSPKLTFAYGSSKIYKSADSGKTWKVVLATSLMYLTDGKYNYISFTDSLHGYLLGINANDSGVIYKTQDGGNTWTSFNLPKAYSFIQSVQFVTTSIAYGIDVLDKSGKNYYEVVKSIDGGHTWFSANSGISDLIVSIAFTDSITGYVVIADSTGTNEIYKTTDGAKSWNLQQDLGLFPNGGFTIGSFFKFINANIGYFYNNYSTGNKNIAFTTNGGGTTTSIKPNKETFNFKIYPNPSQSAFTLSASLPNNSPAVLSIYDIAGKLVSSQILQPIQGTLNQQIPTSNLSSGYYMLSLEQNGNRVTRKLLKD